MSERQPPADPADARSYPDMRDRGPAPDLSAPPADLREQVDALPKMWHLRRPASSNNDLEAYVPMDAVLAVFAERERRIRAEYAPDESPGDVIAAEPDGTIVLDDAITTWNPARATAFLLAERERLLRERIEALPLTEKRRNLSTRDRTATEFKADVLAEFDDHPPGQ